MRSWHSSEPATAPCRPTAARPLLTLYVCARTALGDKDSVPADDVLRVLFGPDGEHEHLGDS